MLDTFISLYDQFLSIFPPTIRPVVSLVVFVLLVIWAFKLIRQNLIWLIILVIFIPASVPLLRSIFFGLLAFLNYVI